MCRIFGVIQSTHTHSYPENFVKVASNLVHGGPDSQGFIHFPLGGIGATRLTITGLDGGNQPYIGNNGIYAVLNGQIYNHKQLRYQLEAKGYTFTDHCDGSLIPALYEEYGSSFLSHLNGMFALAVLDMRTTPTLFLAVDAMGVKPLYYSRTPDGLAFCSEIAPLATLTQTPLTVNPAYIDEVFRHRIVMGGNTLYTNVHSLQPGQSIALTLGGALNLSSYQPYQAPKALPHLRDTLEAELALMMDSETDACFIVSGGVDSSLITALAARHSSKPLTTFHVCTKNSAAYNENTYARELANHYGTCHHEVEVDLADFPIHLAEFTEALGQPDSAPQSLSAFMLAKTIRAEGFKVAYGGEGADELFGGYARMVHAQSHSPLDILAYTESLAPFATNLLPQMLTPEYLQTHPPAKLSLGSLEDIYAFERFQRLPAHLLRRADHLFMASAVEMRVPLCQPAILHYAKNHPNTTTTAKPEIYKAAHGLVPASIFNRPKHHFVLPIVEAYRTTQHVKATLADTLRGANYLDTTIFNHSNIAYFLNQPASSLTADEILMLFTLAVYELTVAATCRPVSHGRTLQVYKSHPISHGGHHVILN